MRVSTSSVRPLHLSPLSSPTATGGHWAVPSKRQSLNPSSLPTQFSIQVDEAVANLDFQKVQEVEAACRSHCFSVGANKSCEVVLKPASEFAPLHDLPESAESIKIYSDGMPGDVQKVPMRLVKIKSFLLWEYVKVSP